MEAKCALGLMSAVLAFLAASLVAGSLTDMQSRKRMASLFSGTQGGARGFAAWRLQHGFSSVMPVTKVLLRRSKIGNAADAGVRALADCGYATSAESLASVAAVALLAAFALGAVASGSLLGAAAVVVCLAAMALAFLSSRAEKRGSQLRECMPDALRALSACFSSGLSLVQSFRQLAQSGTGPVRMLFERSAHVLETGGTVKEALTVLGNAGASELAFVSAALDVQHQTGGPMTPVLEAACAAVESELELERSLRVQTAQAKLSARIVSIMPLVLIALFSLVSEDFLGPFFASGEGMALLALALTLQVAGMVSVRRVLHAEAIA